MATLKNLIRRVSDMNKRNSFQKTIDRGSQKLSCEAACCWSHMRRRVFDAHKAGFVKSARMLDMIRDLYRIERAAKDKAEAKGSETALFQA